MLLNVGMLIVAPGQTEMEVMALTVGVGYMITVKAIVGPVQPYDDVGVTVMVPVMFAPVLLAGAVQDGILPEPEVPSPIAVFEFAHE